jgi:hypothetical protein
MENRSIYSLADEISELQGKVWKTGFVNFVVGFFSGIGSVILMWLLHR